MANDSILPPKQPESSGSVSKPKRQTIRVGHETVELDVDAVKEFVETVREKTDKT